MSYLDSENNTILAQQARHESNARTYLRHLPPLIVSKEQIDDIAAIFEEAVTAANARTDTEVAT